MLRKHANSHADSLKQMEMAAKITSDPNRRRIYLQAIENIKTKMAAEGNAARPQPISANPMLANKDVPSRLSMQVTMPENVGPQVVDIVWEEGGVLRTETLTEGECRGRFTTTLRDLKFAKTWTDLAKRGVGAYRHTKAFYRAGVYYRALSQFYPGPPTMKQCNVSHHDREIFEVVAHQSPDNEK